MLASTQRGSRVLYVAGSTREFPADVQEWLGYPENRAAASPNIHDALAAMAKRPQPTAIIVSIEAVDWEEMEFFDLAARIARDTTIYVAGHAHHQTKIEAAVQRGAKRFNTEDLAQELARPAPGSARTTPRELLAGTLRSFPHAPARNLHVTLVPEESSAVAHSKPEIAPPTPEVETPDSPPVRLVTPADTEDESIPPKDEFENPIPFPWAPAANRPKRTPPSARVQPDPAGAPNPTPAAPEASPARRPPSPELTPEELAALLGRPGTPPPPTAQEKAL